MVGNPATYVVTGCIGTNGGISGLSKTVYSNKKPSDWDMLPSNGEKVLF